MTRNDLIKAFFCYPFDIKSRRLYRTWRISKLKLIMTLVIRNEEEIIEQNIRFHKAMGVDGFIVISHNSTDRTNEILEKLKKEGLILEIIYKTTPAHQRNVWVDEMIKIASKRYKADWIINADADEFYYSKQWNLKKSIYEMRKFNINVFIVDSYFLFPDNRDDFLNCPYFVERFIPYQELELMDEDEKDICSKYTAPCPCRKVIHKTKGFKKIWPGNHGIKMFKRRMIKPADILLYHYGMKNYAGYEAKIKRWQEAIKHTPQNMSGHIRAMIKLYNEGRLREDYEANWGIHARKVLEENGQVVKDPSVINFMKYHNISPVMSKD